MVSLMGILESAPVYRATQVINWFARHPMRGINYTTLDRFVEKTQCLDETVALCIAPGDFQSRYDKAKPVVDGIEGSIKVELRNTKGAESIEPIRYDRKRHHTILGVGLELGDNTYSEIGKIIGAINEYNKTQDPESKIKKLVYFTSIIIDKKGNPKDDQPILLKADLAKHDFWDKVRIELVGVPLTQEEIKEGGENRERREYVLGTANYAIHRFPKIRELHHRINKRRKERGEL